MLAQSNQGKTRLPLPSLDFGDRDLTDAFCDARDGTHSSISGFGHPRGSTPISVLSSRRSTPSTALSMENSESRRTLPNMSALLDYLDNDTSNPFLPRPNSSRKQKPSEFHLESCSPRSIASTPPHPNSTTPRAAACAFESTSHFVETYDNHTHRFRAVPPNSSTPFARSRHDSTQEEISEISSPLNKRHILPSVLKPNFHSLHFSEQMPNRLTSYTCSSLDDALPHLPGRHSLHADKAPSDFPPHIPARIPSKGPSAADRLAAAVMEGAPESHWTFRIEHDSASNQAGIRRSKLVDELLQPIQPPISYADKQSNLIPDASRSTKDDDLPTSLIKETRRSFHLPHPPIIPSATSDSIGQSRLTKSAGYSSSPNLIRPTPQRPSTIAPGVSIQHPHDSNSSTANKQVELLDARVNQLLSHIRSDQLEKANLVSSLVEARAEVALLRDEVRLLRIGVQRLGEGRSYPSADARLEQHRLSMMTLIGDEKKDNQPNIPQPQPFSSRIQRESLEVWLSENTLPPAANNESSQPLLMSPKPLDPRPSSCSNPCNDQIAASPRTIQPSSPVQSISSQKKHLHKVENENQDLIEKFTVAKRSTETSIMNDLAQQFLGDLALGLSFTRHVDQLLMNPTSSHVSTLSEQRQSKLRPDSEIFTPVNLDRLVSRLKAWKQIVLCYSQSSKQPGPVPDFNNN